MSNQHLDEPRVKLKVHIEPLRTTLIDPPQLCIVCDVEKQSYCFLKGHDDVRVGICHDCRARSTRRGLPWGAGVNWNDQLAVEQAQAMVFHLEREAHARRG